MRIRIRTSRTAIWARRLGSLAIPLVVLPVALHHLGFIDSPSFFAAALLALAVAALAAFVAMLALVRLWISGDQGWILALVGLFLGLVCLAPFGWYGYLAFRYPAVTDIATVPRGELPLLFLPDNANMPPPKLISPELQHAVFPNATTRTYPLDANLLFELAERQARAEGWDLKLVRPPEGSSPGRINARIVTLPGWREEAVIRVTPIANGAAIDMRSASINAPHDFGSNGQRIARFMVGLDNEVTTLLRDNPNANQPVDNDDDEPAVVDGDAG